MVLSREVLNFEKQLPPGKGSTGKQDNAFGGAAPDFRKKIAGRTKRKSPRKGPLEKLSIGETAEKKEVRKGSLRHWGGISGS